MADEKTSTFEETKWWIDRGPVKEREKAGGADQGNHREMGLRAAQEIQSRPGGQESRRHQHQNPQRFLRRPRRVGILLSGNRHLSAGKAGQDQKRVCRCPPGARGIVVDAGYSFRVIITGEPIGRTLRRYQFHRRAVIGLLGQRPIGGRAGFRQYRRGAETHSRRIAALF